MVKKIFLLLIFLILTFICYSLDLKKLDEMSNNYENEKVLKILLENFNPSNPDPALIWRIEKEYYEIADAMKDRKLTIQKCEEGMNFGKTYLDLKAGDKMDLAKIVYWYNVLYSRRGKAIGIKESLDIIYELFLYADKSLEHNPTFADPYYLKAKIDEALPGIFGGDSYRMGINFTKALSYDPENMWILIDAATSFYDRNWSVEEKIKKNNEWPSKIEKNSKIKKESGTTIKYRDYEKSMTTDGTPQNLSDREYAKQLLEKAIEVYNKKQNPTNKDKNKIQEAYKLLKKYK